MELEEELLNEDKKEVKGLNMRINSLGSNDNKLS